MITQRRFLCKECHREFLRLSEYYVNSSPVTITGNPVTSPNCPTCGSPEVIYLEFKPLLPGLDIPRENLNELKQIHLEQTSKTPGLTGYHATYSEVENPVRAHFGNRQPEDLIPQNKIILEQIEKETGVFDNSDMD
jgi:hypothetical protein